MKNEVHTEPSERDKIHNTIDFDGYLHSRTAFVIYFLLLSYQKD